MPRTVDPGKRRILPLVLRAVVGLGIMLLVLRSVTYHDWATLADGRAGEMTYLTTRSPERMPIVACSRACAGLCSSGPPRHTASSERPPDMTSRLAHW